MPRSLEPKPTLFVLYGATGDLCKRMVLPAFYQLWKLGLMPKQWRLLGNGRGDVAHEDFRQHFHDSLEQFAEKPERADWKKFSQRLFFAGGGFNTESPGSLLRVLEEQRHAMGARAQLIHYFAVPPTAFVELTRALKVHDLARGARVIYEKPYGTSPRGFSELDHEVHQVLDEKQVFRIDHFLGKEGTQDLHLARMSNRMLSAIWSREHVRAVQIDVPETLDVKDRADFYDHTGATLDMLVTHLFQLAAEVAMEPPRSLEAADIQRARAQALRHFRPLTRRDVVLGQFVGFRDEKGIRKTSHTDTLVAARLWVDSPRWKGVPFLLRTGKRMKVSKQQVTLILREPESRLPARADGSPPPSITFSVAGDGALDLTMTLKKPGPGTELVSTTAHVDLGQLAPHAHPLPPYVRLIHDAMVGDRSLFTEPVGLREVWRAAAPLLRKKPRVLSYEPKTFGPKQADELAAPLGWR